MKGLHHLVIIIVMATTRHKISKREIIMIRNVSSILGDILMIIRVSKDSRLTMMIITNTIRIIMIAIENFHNPTQKFIDLLLGILHSAPIAIDVQASSSSIIKMSLVKEFPDDQLLKQPSVLRKSSLTSVNRESNLTIRKTET